MEVVKIFEMYWEEVKRSFVYAQYCAESEMRAPVCRNFWTWIAIASVVIAAVVILCVGKRIIRERLEFYRNKKRLAARAIVASDEEIQAVAWRGDALKGDLASIPADELADKFRQALTKPSAPSTAPSTAA
jgi:hypothetical protein